MALGGLVYDAGGRKFIYGILLTVGVFVLAVMSKITYQELLSAVEWIFGIFVAGNVIQKFSGSSQAVIEEEREEDKQ